ncbi:phenylacetaldoxime dehydratase family protein [Novosphingobium sp.]|uniref:phenylacetaldoxime dehydratase family protein n=1 Tax=Novosphingobium sp. TaxID=1874826 RepID=UPI002B4599CA|nr:phenylacetaldoxime dehydratase family protein [Novosphingobium sp.]HKR91934.1 phenylacetaldoxime dehydratase family protein [Novosphingobium sp.]
MESAIPPHLRCPRTRARRCADDYQPPVPAWTARGDTALEQVVMAYYGVQWRAGEEARAGEACAAIADQLKNARGVSPLERARYLDPQGYENQIHIVYWTDLDAYRQFAEDPVVEGWWRSLDRESDSVGVFREVFSPRVTHMETLFNAPDYLVGAGSALGRHSDSDVQEHAYWGGMRDRMPISQVDPLPASGEVLTRPGPSPARIRLVGHDNIAVIRSGQDWSKTTGTERELYLSKMAPTLRAGMDFLSTRGLEIGCYANRLMYNLDASGQPIDRAFGLGYWRSLEDMEAWAEHHPTHIAIFDGFMDIARTLQGQFDLRLFHEVCVVKSDQQQLEYIGCHDKTGLMAALAA